MLCKRQILNAIKRDEIIIDPMPRPEAFGPNSVNLRLHPKILEIKFNHMLISDKSGHLGIDSRTGNGMEEREFDCTHGFLLRPGSLYLASTIEKAGSDHYHPRIDGRSSMGRMFCFIHVTAGYGDVGFKSQWTLELITHLPITVWAGQEIAQISFEEFAMDYYDEDRYVGRYKNQDGPVPSKGIGDPIWP